MFFRWNVEGESKKDIAIPAFDQNRIRVTFYDPQWNQSASIIAEIADTPERKRTGLMGRTTLSDEEGMIFSYDRDQTLTFWMKNTLIPLDILFVDSAGRVADIQTMNPCEQDPCKVYSSVKPARYAVEVAEGFAKRYGVIPGHLVQVGRIAPSH